MPARILVVLIVFFLLAVADASAARLYKWVDDSGEVHYSDSIPPDEAQKRREREVKSESGQTVDVIEPPPTRQELQALEQARREAEAEARRQQQAAERDRALLKMYASVDEIRATRDERLAAVESRLRASRKKIGTLRSRLAQRRVEAARIERSSDGDPAKVYAEIADFKKLIAGYRGFIATQEAEKQRIRERFEANVQRFESLSNAAAEPGVR